MKQERMLMSPNAEASKDVTSS